MTTTTGRPGVPSAARLRPGDLAPEIDSSVLIGFPAARHYLEGVTRVAAGERLAGAQVLGRLRQQRLTAAVDRRRHVRVDVMRQPHSSAGAAIAVVSAAETSVTTIFSRTGSPPRSRRRRPAERLVRAAALREAVMGCLGGPVQADHQPVRRQRGAAP